MATSTSTSTQTPIVHLPRSGTLIRPLAHTNSDIQSLAHHANNPKIAQYMRNAFPSPYKHSDASSWITFTMSQNPKHDFCICLTSTNTVIGAIGLKPRTDIQHCSMELGYWLSEEYWGRGIVSEAVEEFVRWVFGRKEFGHVVRLDAEVFDGNEGSKRVLEKAGFVCEGRRRCAVEKGGVVLDTFVYALIRQDLEAAGTTHSTSSLDSSNCGGL
ncbi:acyl-CoA N-acyltransferase [Aspergillus similis]